jgi:hypothetical protein
MKNRIRFAITLTGAFLCALPNVAMAQSGPGDSQGGQAAAIEGTWVMTIHRVEQGLTFTALGSFTAGGVALATGTIDRSLEPLPNSPLYGTWVRTGNNSYAVTLNFFVFDASGNPQGMIINPMTFQLVDDNTLAGTAPPTALFCPVNGYVVSNKCSSILGSLKITGNRCNAGSACLPPSQ